MRPVTKSNGCVPKDVPKVEPKVEPKDEPKILPKTVFKVPQSTQKTVVCVFCKCNGESPWMYEQHTTKDPNGKVICPVLRRHVCEFCGATGGEAHTRSHCPFAVMGRSDPFFREMFRPSTSSDHTFYNMGCLKKTRLNSAGKPRK